MTKQQLDVDKLQIPMYELHDSGVNLSYEWRVKQLQILHKLMKEQRNVFLEALSKDLGRYPTESVCAECIPIESEVQYMLKHLKKWMKPERVSTPMLMLPATASIESKPLQPPGVLIIGPFNYPIQLILKPLAGVLAGGNPCVIKPSELTPHVAQAIHDTITQYFEPCVVQVVLGGVPETQALLAKSWSKVLFTGSERVGKIVAEACSKTLTPCILELGGKSATVVDESVPVSQIQNIADRIIFGKLFNSGQVCIAPDTLFVHNSHIDSLKKALLKSIENQFGKDPQKGELARIVNKQSAQRLIDMIQEVEDKAKSTILMGGSNVCVVEDRYVAPTIVLNPPSSCRLLQEEVFGPILPIVTFDKRQDAIKKIQTMNKSTGTPLFLYVFTTQNDVFKTYTDKCRSGGAVRNDVLIQLANPEQPLGGLGSSGYGRYFGKYSFDAFTHKYPVTYRPLGSVWDFNNLRCHPYEGMKAQLLEEYLLYLPQLPAAVTPRRMMIFGIVAFGIVPLLSVVRPMLYNDENPPSELLKIRLASTLEGIAAWLRDDR